MGIVRNIKVEVERLLWGISGGRCEFDGCNKILYRHEVTGDHGNYAEKAHIYAVNSGGARFCPDSENFKNSVKNLMLVCPQCHINIDRNEQKYTPETLFEMKRKHETRIYILTSIGADLHSHIVYYTANISGSFISVNEGDAKNALACYGRFPTENPPIDLSQKGNLIEDIEDDFYTSNSKNLCRAVKSKISDIVKEGESLALFSIAPQPLLIYLGTLLNDKYNIIVFQCHRRESDKWRWDGTQEQIRFVSTVPNEFMAVNNIALVISLSSSISFERILKILGGDTLIYSVSIESPNRTFVTNPGIMDDFVSKSREVLEIIKQRHGNKVLINVFPSMPASLALRFGMDYMAKTDNNLMIYDEHPGKGFVLALQIGENHE
jgi:hypothetical protein